MTFPTELIERLISAKSILFFTGAGISAESGIATFRGENGLWNKLKPEELANFNAFMRNPDMVWEWYQYRRSIVEQAEPNAGHTSIKEFEKYFHSVTVVTQNVDNLHRRAGSSNVFELHGNIERNFCVDCKTFYNEIELEQSTKVPHCKKCGGLIRPDVVWFGEMLPQDQFTKSETAARACDICFVVGTSAVVYPAAYIPHTAQQYGAAIIEINIQETDLSSSADFTLIGESGDILPKLLDAVKDSIPANG